MQFCKMPPDSPSYSLGVISMKHVQEVGGLLSESFSLLKSRSWFGSFRTFIFCAFLWGFFLFAFCFHLHLLLDSNNDFVRV